MNTTTADPWLKGEGIDHPAIWTFYVVGNITGLVLCTVYACSLLRSKHALTAYDIGVLNLLSGCFVMSAVCATQCFRNLLGGSERFQDWGSLGCTTEAIGHVIAIVVQFLSVATLALYAYVTVNSTTRKLGEKVGVAPCTAWFVFGAVWFYCAFFTTLTYPKSEILLLPAGSYCFPSFRSPMILWLAVSMILSLGIACYCYRQVFETRRTIAEQLAATSGRVMGTEALRGESSVRKAARRTFILLLGFILGWFNAVIACVYAWANNDEITPWLELVVGVFGTCYSIFVPLAYGYKHKEVRRCIRRCGKCTCCTACCDRWFPDLEVRAIDRNGIEKTVMTKRYKSDREVERERRSQRVSERSPYKEPTTGEQKLHTIVTPPTDTSPVNDTRQAWPTPLSASPPSFQRYQQQCSPPSS
jgi:hypothetical protein